MQRLEYKDEMQGLAIFLVVLAHFLGPHTYGNSYPLVEIISSCHMSFFFFLSGYINQKTNHIKDRGSLHYLKKKAQTLLIPFCFWSYVYSLFLSGKLPTDVEGWLEPLNIFPNMHFWFLPVLFVFFINYLLISTMRNFCTGGGRMVCYSIPVLTFIAAGLGTHQYHLIIYAIYLSSFFLGDYLSWNERFRTYIMQDVLFGIVAVVLFIAWKIFPLSANGVAWRSMINIILALICSFGMSIFCYNFFRKIALPLFLKRCLQEMGKMSLVIYVTPFVLIPSSFHFPETFNETLINVISIIMSSAYVFLRYLWGMFIYQIPIVRFIMYGRK